MPLPNGLRYTSVYECVTLSQAVMLKALYTHEEKSIQKLRPYIPRINASKQTDIPLSIRRLYSPYMPIHRLPLRLYAKRVCDLSTPIITMEEIHQTD